MDVYQMVSEISRKVDEMTIDAFAICGLGSVIYVDFAKEYEELLDKFNTILN